MTIDVHAHLLEVGLLETLAASANRILAVERAGASWRLPGYGEADRLLWDLEGRIDSLVARGVETQLVAPPPPLWSKPDWAAGVEESRLLNAATKRAVTASRGRLRGLAVPSLGDPGRAVEEARRWLDDDAFAGMALPTTAAGQPLDGPAFETFFAFLAEHRVFLFMHSVTSERRALLADYTLNTAIGWPVETAIAVARLVFAGTLERHPLNLVLSHGGGVLAWLAGRLDVAYAAPRYEANPACRRHIAHPPSHYLRTLGYDTVVTSEASLDHLLAFAGPGQVLFGSDFPYEIGDAEGRHAAPVLARLPGPSREAIMAGNARHRLAAAGKA